MSKPLGLKLPGKASWRLDAKREGLGAMAMGADLEMALGIDILEDEGGVIRPAAAIPIRLEPWPGMRALPEAVQRQSQIRAGLPSGSRYRGRGMVKNGFGGLVAQKAGSCRHWYLRIGGWAVFAASALQSAVPHSTGYQTSLGSSSLTGFARYDSRKSNQSASVPAPGLEKED